MIIDANAHVTHDGKWFSTDHNARVERLLEGLNEAGVDAATVVGLPGYISNDYVMKVCHSEDRPLLPVGSFNPCSHRTPPDAARAARSELKDLGIVGFKLHPRLGRYDPLDHRVLAVLEEVASWSQPLPVWLCTYLHFRGGVLQKAPVETIHELVGRFTTINFVLAHGGGPDIIRLATAVRDCPNAYLELSHTLTRYRGSSVEMDIVHLVDTFDDRLIFGSDFPEIAVVEAKRAIDHIFSRAKVGAAQKILGDNLRRAISLTS